MSTTSVNTSGSVNAIPIANHQTGFGYADQIKERVPPTCLGNVRH